MPKILNTTYVNERLLRPNELTLRQNKYPQPRASQIKRSFT